VDVKGAKAVGECCLLGLELPGMTPAVNPNVVGLGIGRKVTRGIVAESIALRVFVKKKSHPLLLRPEEVIPQEIEGVPTDVHETGEVRIRWPFPPVFQRRLRPARPGVSVGHYAVSAGTFGLVVRGREGRNLILSNNHVLANENRGAVGDPILQPGDWDGGKRGRDEIGALQDFVPLAADATNTVDAAVAEPYDARDLSPDVIGIGRVHGVAEAALGMAVTKAGRTTRITQGQVTDVDVTLKVGYTDGFRVFTDQFLIQGRGGFSGAGDSGSAILDGEHRVVGLLFGGSPFVTVANRFANVASALQVSPV